MGGSEGRRPSEGSKRPWEPQRIDGQELVQLMKNMKLILTLYNIGAEFNLYELSLEIWRYTCTYICIYTQCIPVRAC